MKKKIICILLILITVLQSNIVFAGYSDDDDDNTIILEYLDKAYIVFPVTSKKASVYSCLHWRTQGFILTVTDLNGKVVKADETVKISNTSIGASHEHPFLKYSF